LLHRLIEEVGEVPGKHQVKAYMQELRPVAFREGVLHIAYDDEFSQEHAAKLLEPENRQLMDRCFARITPVPGGHVVLKRWIDAVSSDENRHVLQASEEVRARVEANPFVGQVRDLFDGEIVDVRG